MYQAVCTHAYALAKTCAHVHTHEMTCIAYPEIGGGFSVHQDLGFPIMALAHGSGSWLWLLQVMLIFEGPGLGHRQL